MVGLIGTRRTVVGALVPLALLTAAVGEVGSVHRRRTRPLPAGRPTCSTAGRTRHPQTQRRHPRIPVYFRAALAHLPLCGC